MSGPIRTFALSCLLIAGFAGFAAAQNQPSRCNPELPSLRSGKGQDFTASAYGVATWQAKSASGRRLPYAVHVWKGKTGGRTAFLTFDEIPGTSGPNYHLVRRLNRIPAQINWHAARTFAFEPRFVVHDGPLAGEWTLANCPAS